MNYIEDIFGVPEKNLSFDSIANYFQTPRIESNILEFKSYNANANFDKIYETICAFLNSDGGILIWGAPQETKNNGVTECVGNLVHVETFFEKDQLVSKVAGNITPPPKGVKVHSFKKNSKYVYLFEVNKSEYSPHQTGNKYYMRLDGQNKIAPHYFIEALFKKITFPRLGGYVKFDHVKKAKQSFHPITRVSLPAPHEYIDRVVLSINVFVMNHTQFQNEEDVKFYLVTDYGMIVKSNDVETHKVDDGGSRFNEENATTILHFGEAPYFSYKILYDFSKLEKMGFSSKLMLFFGGKFSPMQSSLYVLNFNKLKNPKAVELINNGTIEIHRNANDFVSEIQENRFTGKRPDDMTEAQAVDKILGRSKKV